MKKNILFCLTLITILPLITLAQCDKFSEKYQVIICGLDSYIKSAFDTVNSEFGQPVSEKMRNLNNKNCKKIDKMITDLDNEFKSKFAGKSFELTELTNSYINSLKIYSNSLRDLTSGDQYLIYNSNACTNNYQQSENAKNNLLLYLNYQAIIPAIIKPGIDTAISGNDKLFHASFAFGSYMSSIQKNLEDVLSTAPGENLSFKKLSVNFNFDYNTSKSFRTGLGISSIPESGSNGTLPNGTVQERIYGISLNMHETYIPYFKKSIEIGITLGIVANLITEKKNVFVSDTVLSSFNSNYVFTSDTINLPNESVLIIDSVFINYNYNPASGSTQNINFTNHTSTIGLFLSPSVFYYLNKNLSFNLSLCGILNSSIEIPGEEVSNSLIIESNKIKFSAFFISGGITIHF